VGDDAQGGKEAVAKGLLQAKSLVNDETHCEQKGHGQHKASIEAELLVIPHFVKATFEAEVMQRKVHPGQKHKQSNDILNIGTVISDAGLFGGKTAGGQGSKTMINGIVERHSA
jgi:hypothetical protein